MNTDKDVRLFIEQEAAEERHELPKKGSVHSVFSCEIHIRMIRAIRGKKVHWFDPISRLQGFTILDFQFSLIA